MIGTVRLVNIDINRRSVEWGYGINPELWGRGYIFEIQENLKDYIFNKLKLNRLWGKTRIDNDRTKSSLLAAGAKEEGIFRESQKDSNGVYYDVTKYQKLVDDANNDIIVWTFTNEPTSKNNPDMYAWLNTDENGKLILESLKSND